MIEHVHHEDFMREIGERHMIVVDNMSFEETRCLEDAIVLDDICLKETRHLENSSLSHMSNLHDSYHTNECVSRVS